MLDIERKGHLFKTFIASRLIQIQCQPNGKKSTVLLTALFVFNLYFSQKTLERYSKKKFNEIISNIHYAEKVNTEKSRKIRNIIENDENCSANISN